MVPGEQAYGLIDDAAAVLARGLVQWVGARSKLPAKFNTIASRNLQGRLVTPALIDCHTHCVAAGNRAMEFEMRLQGASYEEVARAGGGILSTVRATRDADEHSLLASALPRIDALIAEGAGTVEIKSGYGLDCDTELRMLRVARRIADVRNIRVQTTFLGAHAIPQEYHDRADDYIDEICLPSLEAACAEGLVDSVDGFCEGIAFSSGQIRRVFAKAIKLGLPVKLHAEQLSNTGGAKLAAEFNALSADHVEFIDSSDVAALAQSGTCAVLLPGAYYTLQETQAPPVEALRAAGVPMAIATDCNPGSSPLSSLLLCMNMACTLYRMTPQEALAGVTRQAARALGIATLGTVASGQTADLAVWDIEHPAELAYRMGFNPLHCRVIGGEF